jgi:acetamidase/formamidase
MNVRVELNAALILCAAAVLHAETHQFAPKLYYRAFSATNPVALRIKPGDTVITKTLDAGGGDENGVRRHETFGNPLTGPICVEGAEPGDALEVILKKVRLNRNWGWTSYRLGLFSLMPSSIERLYSNHYKDNLVQPGRDYLVPWDIDLQSKTVRLREPVSKKVKLEFAARPMLGCIGVAAGGDHSPDSHTSGAYGGNMDYNRVVEGATVLFPVLHPGALLYLGDGHALQGDGEPTGTGIGTSMDVEFSVQLHKRANLLTPRLETPVLLVSIGSQQEFSSALNYALELATSDMVNWLVNDYGLEQWAAHQLVGVAARYDVVTVAGSVALCIPKKFLVPK